MLEKNYESGSLLLLKWEAVIILLQYKSANLCC